MTMFNKKSLKFNLFKNPSVKAVKLLFLPAFISLVFFALSLFGSPESVSAQYTAPFIKPLEGGIITGFRQEYFDEEKQVSRMHTGIDICAEDGSSVVAAGNGKVVYMGFSPIGGRTIVIRHNEKIRTTYLNIAECFVSTGDRVLQGDIIAAISAEDDPSSLSPHLHFGIIYDGYYLDPEDVLNIDYSSISKYIVLEYVENDFKIQAEWK